MLFYHLKLLNSRIAPPLGFFFLPAGGRCFPCSNADCKEGRSFHCPLLALLWLSSIYLLCLSSTFYLLEREGGTVRIAKHASPFFSGKYFCDVHSKKMFVQL